MEIRSTCSEKEQTRREPPWTVTVWGAISEIMSGVERGFVKGDTSRVRLDGSSMP